jgi:hypothetical protein
MAALSIKYQWSSVEFTKDPWPTNMEAILKEVSRLPVSQVLAQSSLEYTFSGGYAKKPYIELT